MQSTGCRGKTLPLLLKYGYHGKWWIADGGGVLNYYGGGKLRSGPITHKDYEIGWTYSSC